MSKREFGGGWNYRVVERDHNGETTFRIHEVYYDDEGGITAWSEPMSPYGEDSKSALRADLRYMCEALARPTLQYDELPGVDGG